MFKQEFRCMSFVPRWSIIRTINQQSIADHSFYVALYTSNLCRLLDLSDEVTVKAVTYALWHDVPERVTGDIPGPIKGLITSAPVLNHVEHTEIASLNGPETATSPGFLVKRLVKSADYMDQCFFLATEMQMGNKVNAKQVFDKSVSRLMASLLTLMPETKATEIVNSILETTQSPPTFPEVYDL